MRPFLFYSDVFMFVFIALMVCFIFWASKRVYYREAWRRIRNNKWALVCLFIILSYGTIAFIDSIHYKSVCKDKKGNERKDNEGNYVYGNPKSLLDVLIAGVYPGVEIQEGRLNINIEDTYSSPFASMTFDKVRDPATGLWDYEKLKEQNTHWMGTDKVGGDVFYKLLKGIRTALIVGLVTTMIVIPFAIFFGVTAGYFGGKVDDIIQFIYITLGSIPSILLISAMMIIVQAKLSASSDVNVYLKDDRIVIFLCAILGLIGWSGLCRLLRAETIKLRELDYVQAAKALGENSFVVIVKHIIPNLIHIVLISSIIRFSGLVMVEAILAYIKIGVPSTIQSWGRIVDGARSQLARDPIIWWPVTGAFIFMFLLVLSINIFGDTVRDALDPKLRT